jgi:glucosamine-6-phosphate deaminase
MIKPVMEKTADKLRVEIYEDRPSMGLAAATAVVTELKGLLAQYDEVNMVFAAAPSQNEFLASLVATEGIDWSRVNAFHLDEYIGLPKDAPQRFANFLKNAIFDKLPFKSVNLLDGNVEPAVECARYGSLLAKHPLHIACIGIGENGHLAFNDPPVADFEDPSAVKVVELDDICRNQQVNDGCFPTVADVPTHALTLTIPAIMAAKSLYCMVPGPTKTNAVMRTVTGPISTECPASIMRKHDKACLYVDRAAAALIM